MGSTHSELFIFVACPLLKINNHFIIAQIYGERTGISGRNVNYGLTFSDKGSHLLFLVWSDSGHDHVDLGDTISIAVTFCTSLCLILYTAGYFSIDLFRTIHYNGEKCLFLEEV